LWFKDKDKDLSLKDEDKDKDLKIGPRGSSRTRTFLEDNNTAYYSSISTCLPKILDCSFQQGVQTPDFGEREAIWGGDGTV